ncbi:MAG: hypothetical protein EHM17_02175 [Verrucomicrobiaceae bacterium]|nr:MAG: hypothetical protein EHM17_02175 [Verrucomicrobiaceae bacterium]
MFRVPREHDGRGVVCPSCRRLLKIPLPEDQVPELVIPLSPGAPESGNKKHRRRNSRRRAGHDWESTDADEAPSPQRASRQMFWMLLGGGTLFALIVAGVLMTMLGSRPETPSVSIPAALEKPAPQAAVATDAPLSDAEFLAQAEPLAGKFLSASRIEDLLSLVRNPQVAEPRLRGIYPDGKIEAPGMVAFNTRAEVSRLGSFLSVTVRTQGMEEKPLAFFSTPDGLRIDWEAWSGWSEMPWEEFLSAKPAGLKLFRVVLSPVEYYNFAFSDDRKWQSYRLESPDGVHAIYGYVERNSTLDSMIRPSPDQKQAAMTLQLEFPENATSPKQVLIRKMIAEGWMLENAESP